MNRRLSYSFIAVFTFLLLGLLIAIQMKDVNDSNRQTAYAQKDLTELQEQVMALIRENDDLTQKNSDLSTLIASMGQELSGDNAALQAVLEEKKKAEVFAGLTSVEGTGITLTVTPIDASSVNAKTLLLLLNECRAGGALAISINDERIVSMTEIRDTGTENPQIIINGNSYSAVNTFSINAIYRPNDLNRGKELLETLLEQFGSSSSFTLTVNDTLTVQGLPEDSIILR